MEKRFRRFNGESEVLQINLIYEKRGAVNWKYFLQLDDAEFEISFDKGIELMRELTRFFDQLENG